MTNERANGSDHYPLLGTGIYTVPEASRLTQIRTLRIRRWLRGYDFMSSGVLRHSGPVFSPDLPEINGRLALSFLDLLEVRYIEAFVHHGVTWPVMRDVYSRAVQLVGTTHPFSTRKFRSDGASILAQLGEGEPVGWLDLRTRQQCFRFIEKFLFTGIEYGKNDHPTQWWPREKRGGVLLDPHRRFGQPITAEKGIPTLILAQAYKAEKTYKAVARWMEVDQKTVRQAVEFERSLALAA